MALRLPVLVRPRGLNPCRRDADMHYFFNESTKAESRMAAIAGRGTAQAAILSRKKPFLARKAPSDNVSFVRPSGRSAFDQCVQNRNRRTDGNKPAQANPDECRHGVEFVHQVVSARALQIPGQQCSRG